MKYFIRCSIALAALIAPLSATSQEVIELDTTRIRGNTELPKAMFVVPWQDKVQRNDTQQQLVIHNLYSDLFDPVMPGYIPVSEYTMQRDVIRTK